MKNIILVSKEMSNDTKQMENIVIEAARIGHSGGNLCFSGMSLEFRLEEDAITYANQPDMSVFRADPKSNKLVAVEKSS